jgi:hypothetical protein
LRAIDPVLESEQGTTALRLLDAYHGTNTAASPRKLHVVYFTPSDRDPEPRYRERLDAIMEDIRAFYRDGMEQAGFGPKTFGLARDAGGKLIIHLVKGREPDAAYKRSGFQQNLESDASSRKRIQDASRPVLKAAGIDFDRETVLIFCNLARWDENARTFSHHSPYAGFANATSGWCFAVDSVILNVDDLAKKEPMLKDAEWGNESLGKFNRIFIGGIAHELGHAFSLPHCGERWDEKTRGKSLLGVTFPQLCVLPGIKKRETADVSRRSATKAEAVGNSPDAGHPAEAEADGQAVIRASPGENFDFTPYHHARLTGVESGFVPWHTAARGEPTGPGTSNH